MLALLWLGAGLSVLTLGLRTAQPVPCVLGLLAAWYGVIWLYVAREGRRLSFEESLRPWRIRAQ